MKSRLAILTMLVLGMLLSTDRRRPGGHRPRPSDNASIAAVRRHRRRRRRAAAASSATRTPAPARRPSNGGGGSVAGTRPPTSQPARQVEAGANNSTAPVHRLRGHPGPARRHRAAERGPRAAPSHRRRALAHAHTSDSERRAPARLSSLTERDRQLRRARAPARGAARVEPPRRALRQRLERVEPQRLRRRAAAGPARPAPATTASP